MSGSPVMCLACLSTAPISLYMHAYTAGISQYNTIQLLLTNQSDCSI
jgi:hypothetical protein